MAHRETWFVLLLALCVLTTPGCSDPEAEGLAVSLQTDFVPGVEFDRVRATVDDARAFELETDASDSYVRPRPITTYRGLEPGRRDVEVTLWEGARQVAARRVSMEFRGSLLLNVVIARTCAGVVCDDDETCVAGACVSPRCVTGEERECPRAQCASPADCTASTMCVEPSCIAGICLETGGDTCAVSEVCVPDTGCVPRGTAHDAGLRDASLDAPTLDAPPPDAPG
ncbi:MAG: hypothetical protein J0L92_12445, partial [Deltaproteobacteria bacterium]|nr:hypothetical protein [Deltaproteobacteria bacterium]